MSDLCGHGVDEDCVEGCGTDCETECKALLRKKIKDLTAERDALKVENESVKRFRKLESSKANSYRKAMLSRDKELANLKQERNKERVFVEHIKNHLKTMSVGNNVECRICDKTIDEIYEEEKSK